jgi:hypothetical protein
MRLERSLASVTVNDDGGDEARRDVGLTEEEEDASPLRFNTETVSGLGWLAGETVRPRLAWLLGYGGQVSWSPFSFSIFYFVFFVFEFSLVLQVYA